MSSFVQVRMAVLFIIFTILMGSHCEAASANSLMVEAGGDHQHHHGDDGDHIILELIHRHDPRVADDSFNCPLERIQDLLENDMIRRYMIAHHKIKNTIIRGRQLAAAASQSSSTNNDNDNDNDENKNDLLSSFSTAAALPLFPYKRWSGMYLVRAKVGTPPQTLNMLVDTGSDLTWVHCAQRLYRLPGHHHTLQKKRGNLDVFRPYLSSSFKTIPCSSPLCKEDHLIYGAENDACPSPSASCHYEYSYAGNEISGYFANETVRIDLTNGKRIILNDYLIGCTTRVREWMDFDGLLGLGFNGDNSFTDIAFKKFGGGKFSYCLVQYEDAYRKSSSSNSGAIKNYLLYGNNTRYTLGNSMQMTYTGLYLLQPFYGVLVEDISVGGVMLGIPFLATIGADGPEPSFGDDYVMLDSGSSFTTLVPKIYDPLVRALMHKSSYLASFMPVEPVAGLPFQYCFNSSLSSHGSLVEFKESLVPRIAFHLRNGAVFEPHVKGYIMADEDDGAHLKCISIVPNLKDDNSNIIGNLMQANFFWEFDVYASRLGFAPSTCHAS